MTVRTRFAPSPTGVLHIGSVRTALFSWLYARRYEGKAILRIEDTDRERSTAENVDAILDGLAWLELDFDEAPVFQSARFVRYLEVSDEWLREGRAYHCYCSREELEALRAEQMQDGDKTRYDGRCRNRKEALPGVKPVVRFKNPVDGAVVVNDLVRGEVSFNNSELDDLIIVRSDGSPTYNFTVVVDDADMEITHVIRGDDHLNNTPRQLNMFEALGKTPPGYAHLPMILGADGAKLSKRHGAVDVREYREQGYLPQALLNYLVRLGWSHGDQELFSIDEMIALFEIGDVNHSASTYNPEKLRWLNQQHIIRMPANELGEALLPYLESAGYSVEGGPRPADVADVFRERAETLVEMADSARFCYADFDAPDASASRKHLRPVSLGPLKTVRRLLAELADWNVESVAGAIERAAAEHEIALGKIGQPLRVSVTGGSVSPPIDATVFLVGQARALRRLDQAIDMVQQRIAAADGA